VALAVTAASLEQIATEIRNLQKTEVLEAEEPFSAEQKGSSAMPHKRNPIIAERICGLARVVKANAQVALDNVALWHERDISHSSAEKVTLVDSLTLLDYLLDKTTWLVDGLVIHHERCLANLQATRGLVFSSKVLLALINHGLSRADAYKIVQDNSMAVWSDIQTAVPGLNLQERLAADIACPLTEAELEAVFDPQAFLKNCDVLFERLESLGF
jgi:adenylosuccinate lyase